MATITIEYQGSALALPTCGCPVTCDAIALLSKNGGTQQQQQQEQSCFEAISSLRRNRPELSEEQACTLAAEDDRLACGMTCHPVHCHKLPLARNATTTQTFPTSSSSSSSTSSTSLFEKLRPVKEERGGVVKPVPLMMKEETLPLNWSSVKNVDLPPEPFVRYDGVVVATKIHGPHLAGMVKQMVCLFTAAYNRYVNYDIVVFTTLPWSAEQIQQLQDIVPQTKLTVVNEAQKLEKQVEAMTPQEREYLYKRCKVEPGKPITWEHRCSENDSSFVVSLAYAWQAEFRAYHVWNKPILKPYKYMIWMDTDALCTKTWEKDPVQMMVENDLVLMFDNFQVGITRNKRLFAKMKQAYNRSICNLEFDTQGGHLKRMPDCESPTDDFSIPKVHGFHHITNLNFYRSPTNLNFLKILVESNRFSREWDDQLAITLPAAMEAPERAWDYQSHGFQAGIFHNLYLEGKQQLGVAGRLPGFRNYWNQYDWGGGGGHRGIKERWKAGREMCDSFIKYDSR